MVASLYAQAERFLLGWFSLWFYWIECVRLNKTTYTNALPILIHHIAGVCMYYNIFHIYHRLKAWM